MRRTVTALAAAALLVSTAPASSAPSVASPCPGPPLRATAPGETLLWGHIASLARRGSRFELRFDPAWWLGGVTARRAAIEDKVIRPGEAVPNDYYVRDESHRLLTYLVPPGAKATVIVNRRQGLCPVAVTVSELAQIVRGKNPRRRPLLDRRNGLGFWIRVATDTVRSLDQQYQP